MTALTIRPVATTETKTDMNLSQLDVLDDPSTSQRQTGASLDQLFRLARTYNEWSDREVDDHTIHELYDLLKWGPTAGNSSPARFAWVKSTTGKTKLSALAMEANRAKIMAAPVTVIVGHDLAFAETMPRLFPALRWRLRACPMLQTAPT